MVLQIIKSLYLGVKILSNSFQRFLSYFFRMVTGIFRVSLSHIKNMPAVRDFSRAAGMLQSVKAEQFLRRTVTDAYERKAQSVRKCRHGTGRVPQRRRGGEIPIRRRILLSDLREEIQHLPLVLLLSGLQQEGVGCRGDDFQIEQDIFLAETRRIPFQRFWN